MTGVSPSFLGYLRDYLTRRVQDQLRAFPTFSVSEWLECEKAGRGGAWTLPGVVAISGIDGRDYIGHIRPPSPLPGPGQRGKPEVIQPLSREQVELVLEGIRAEAAEYVSLDPAGFLTSNWSAAPYRLWPVLYRFSEAAADATEAVILNEWLFPVYRAGQNAFL